MKLWHGVEPREQANRKFTFGNASPVFVVHKAGAWHWSLYCFDFDLRVKACIGGDMMPENLKSYLHGSASDYGDFHDVSPKLPPQDADECAARVVCFAKWFATRTANGFDGRFDEALFLRSVERRMVAWRQNREKIKKGEFVPKLAQSSLCKLTKSSICLLCPYDKCPTSVVGLPTGLTTSNSLCFLNQALVVLAASGPWSANPNSLIGHLAVEVLKGSVAGEQTETARNNLAQGLFDSDNAGLDSGAVGYSGQQQCLTECLQRLFEHVSGSLVTQLFKYTCTVCSNSTQLQQSNHAIFPTVSPDTEVMQLEEILVMEQTESTVHWRCSTPDCEGDVKRPELSEDHNFALGASFMAGALPDTIIVALKRGQFGHRLQADIKIPSVVPVNTCNVETLETTTELYVPIYVVLHSSGSDGEYSEGRSAFNVPDSVESSVASANGGHYFGAVLGRDCDGVIVYLDGDRLDKGYLEELLAQGKKVVVVVLRKLKLEAVDLFKIAILEESIANFHRKNLLGEWNRAHQTLANMCHRVANQVFLYLRDNDAAVSCLSKEQFASRRENVYRLFRDFETEPEQTGKVVLTAIAKMWDVRIIVHKFRELADNFGDSGIGTLSVFLNDGLLYPTCLSTFELCETTIQTASGTLGLLSGRTSSPAHQAVFDTIIPIIFPLVVTMFDVAPDHEHFTPIKNSSASPRSLTIGALPLKRSSTYWYGRTLMQNLCNKDASKLTRESPNSTVIECSYSMIYHVVQAVERFVPFTHESTHVILGCGRRGPLLLHSMVDKEITVVGLEIAEVAVVESRQLLGKLQANDPLYKPKIHVEVRDVETLTSLDGFTSVSRFAGSAGAGTADHASRNRIDELVLSSPTVQVYWNNHLPNMKNLELSDEIKAEWQVMVLGQTRQETARISTYLYFRVKQAQRAPEISADVVALVSAARDGRVHHLGEHGTPYTRRNSERRVKTSDKKTDVTPSSLAAKTPPSRGRKKSPTANVTANVEPLDPPSTPNTKRKVRPKTGGLDGIQEADSEGGASEPAPAPKKIGRGKPQIPKETGSEASESTSVDKKRKADDLNITAILIETRRNLSDDMEKAHQKMMAEIKRSQQAVNARLLAAEKKGLSKPALTELLKQVTSAGTKSSAELLQQFPGFSTKLAATHDAIKSLPNTLTSQLRGSEKPKERDPLGSEKTKERHPLESTAGVQAELRFALSQLPAELAKALPPAGTQDGVLKVIADLTAGISKKDRDLLWIEQNRGVELKKKAKKKKKKRKEKHALKEKEKQQVMKEKEQIEQLAKKEKKLAKREKEERRKQELDKEKEKLLVLLKQTGVLRKDRKYRSRASSPSSQDSSSSSRDSSPSSQDSESGRRSRSHSRSSRRMNSASRKRSRSRDRARRRRNSASGKRSRSRDRARRLPKRSRDRSKRRSSPDRDHKTRNNKSVLQTDEAGVGEWLESIHLGSFRKIFIQNNIVGADLKQIPSTMLTGFGMAEHQLARFVAATAALH